MDWAKGREGKKRKNQAILFAIRTLCLFNDFK
jgi:hypothetical protein